MGHASTSRTQGAPRADAFARFHEADRDGLLHRPGDQAVAGTSPLTWRRRRVQTRSAMIPGGSYRPTSMAETSQIFRTTLAASGGNNVGIVVPDDVVTAFGRGKRVPVVVTVDGGYQYRSTIASMGGRFLISFNAATRRATGRGAGDEVEVRLDVDDAPRVVEVPDDLAAELARDGAARAAWDKLSYSHQRAHAEAITGAKAADTRARRVAKALDALRS